MLWVGERFRRAIGLYYERSPGSSKQYPQKLEDLLPDERYLAVQRYLRTMYRDPMTGRREWGFVPAPGGGIMGVYSLSDARPIKAGGFRPRQMSFVDCRKYSDWIFAYSPASTHTAQVPSGRPANKQGN